MPQINSSSLLQTWILLSRFPGGKRIFSWILGTTVPYSGTIRPIVENLSKGKATIRLNDRRGVRNHLKSIHAMALANLGEIATGLAVNTAIPADARAILTAFSIEYVKKARGTLIAESTTAPVPTNERQSIEVAGTIVDRTSAPVAHIKATWLVGPTKG